MPNGILTYTAGSELYDIASGTWSATDQLHQPRGGHTATLLPDGKVLVAGRGATLDFAPDDVLASAEIFDPTLGVNGRWIDAGAMLQARGLHTATLIDAPICHGAAPPNFCGEVLIAGGGALSDTTSPPGNVSVVELFAPPPEITQLTPRDGRTTGSASVMIRGFGFTLASTVSFGGVPGGDVRVQSTVQMVVTSPPRSRTGSVEVIVTSRGEDSITIPPNPAAQFLYGNCGVPATGRQVSYPAGYNLVGLPGGSVIASHSLLYSWFNRGSGDAYVSQAPSGPLMAGRGYWAWFDCPTPVSLSGAGGPAISSTLNAYRASMVGNPSGTSGATVTGHDFAAGWVPGLNGGAGGYVVSGYREPQGMAVGQGVWVFSYADSTIAIATQN